MGGAETMVVTAAEALSGQCKMDFLVFGDIRGELEERALALGGSILRMGSPRELGPIRFVKELTQILKRQEYNAVHSHINLASSWVMFAARRAEVPIRVAHSHNTSEVGLGIHRRVYRWVSRRLLDAHSTNLVACSEEAGRHLFGQAWDTNRGIVILNGIDLERFLASGQSTRSMRAEWGLSEEDIAIGMVASFSTQKNHEFMLGVMAEDKACNGRGILVLIGDGDLRETIENQARSLDISDRVQFLGVRHDIPDILGALDLLAMPSLYEGLPVSLIEAQAAGLPSLVSDQVDRGSDLGLGLIKFLPLSDPNFWQRELAIPREVPEKEVIRQKISAAGYDSAVLHS